MVDGDSRSKLAASRLEHSKIEKCGASATGDSTSTLSYNSRVIDSDLEFSKSFFMELWSKLCCNITLESIEEKTKPLRLEVVRDNLAMVEKFAQENRCWRRIMGLMLSARDKMCSKPHD